MNSHLSALRDLGVKDSKKLSPKKRTSLAHFLKKNCFSYRIEIVDVNEIDGRINQKISLNRLEELKMAKILDELQPEEIYIDAADVNEKRFGNSIRKLLTFNPNVIISEHKADEKYPIVSAASIIAKYERDLIIEQLREKYGDFGSGYTSDSKTVEFLSNWIIEKKNIPPFARRSWVTTKLLAEEHIYNRKLTEYF